MSNEKTELQKREDLFLDLLFGEAKGNVTKAKEMAGYSINYKNGDILKRLQDRIIERSRFELAAHGPQAITSLLGYIQGNIPAFPKETLSAIKEVLDRGGIIKPQEEESSEVRHKVLFVLPDKKELNDEAED